MKLIVSHPTGNSNVRAVLQTLFEHNMLAEFHTTFSVSPDNNWLFILPRMLKNEVSRRYFPIPQTHIYTHPWREISRIVLPKFGFKNIIKQEKGWASIDQVYRNLDKAVATRIQHIQKNNEITSVYTYEDGALATFTKAKEMGLQCIYDLPIAYWKTVRDLLNTEALRLPQWKKTLGGGISDSQEKRDRKTEELSLADVVIAPSKFVIDSLPHEAAWKKIIMSPFGSPNTSQQNINDSDRFASKSNRPLRVLFAGSMGQRKGLADLFSAFRLLNTKHIELVVLGSLLDSMEFYKSEFPYFIYEPTRPHQKVLDLMRSCDVFCLPSIVEGRALVMQEAMSQGLPLIITPNTGGEDLIKDGETGFLVPTGRPDLIAEKINWFAEDRNRSAELGQNAKRLAQDYTWQLYGERIVQELQNKGLSSFNVTY